MKRLWYALALAFVIAGLILLALGLGAWTGNDPALDPFAPYLNLMPGESEQNTLYHECTRDIAYYSLQPMDNFACIYRPRGDALVQAVLVSGSSGQITVTTFRLRGIQTGDLVALLGAPDRTFFPARRRIEVHWTGARAVKQARDAIGLRADIRSVTFILPYPSALHSAGRAEVP